MCDVLCLVVTTVSKDIELPLLDKYIEELRDSIPRERASNIARVFKAIMLEVEHGGEDAIDKLSKNDWFMPIDVDAPHLDNVETWIMQNQLNLYRTLLNSFIKLCLITDLEEK